MKEVVVAKSNVVMFPMRERVRAYVESRMSEEERKLSRAFASVAPLTAATYRSALRRFDEWRGARGRDISDESLADYALYLHTRGGKNRKGAAPSTITGHLNAIRFRERELDRPDPKGKETKRMVRMVRRKGADRGHGQAPGLRLRDIEAIIEGTLSDGGLAGIRDAAVVAAGFYCGLRRAEIAALQVEHIEFFEDGTGTLKVARSKTDQTGVGAVLHLPKRAASLILSWMEQANVSDGPLFRSIRHCVYKPSYANKKGMRPDGIGPIIKRRAKAAGFTISSHTLRRSFAQEATRKGASIQQVCQMGRWTNPQMALLYTRSESAAQSKAREIFG